jgi:hypothetical protein
VETASTTARRPRRISRRPDRAVLGSVIALGLQQLAFETSAAHAVRIVPTVSPTTGGAEEAAVHSAVCNVRGSGQLGVGGFQKLVGRTDPPTGGFQLLLFGGVHALEATKTTLTRIPIQLSVPNSPA